MAEGAGHSRAPRTPDGAAADPFAMGLEYLQYDVHRLAIAEEVCGFVGVVWEGLDIGIMHVRFIHSHDHSFIYIYIYVYICIYSCNTYPYIHNRQNTHEKVGVDLAELWGKEAVLLNLWAIQQHAARLVQR